MAATTVAYARRISWITRARTRRNDTYKENKLKMLPTAGPAGSCYYCHISNVTECTPLRVPCFSQRRLSGLVNDIFYWTRKGGGFDSPRSSISQGKKTLGEERRLRQKRVAR